MATKKQINDFLSDPDYLALVELEREQRLLFITDLSEQRVSAFLAWLFRPYEGHGLGERAVRELLLNAWRVSESQEIGATVPSPRDLQGMGLSDLLVETEYQVVAPQNGKGGRTVDLLLTSRNNRLLVCVENKFGSRAHSNQLADYRKALNKKFSGYSKVFIYLDWNEENVPDDEGWVPLSYEWLVKLIQGQEEAGLLSDRALHALRQVREYLSEDAATSAAISSRRDRLIEGVVLRHREVLEVFQEFKRGKWKERFEDVAPSINEPLLVEYHQRWNLWSEVLEQRHHLEVLGTARRSLGDRVEIHVSPARVAFRLREWAGLEADSEGLWGPRVWAWSGKGDNRKYVVGSGVQFANIRPEKEVALRTLAIQLRSGDMKAPPKDASWVYLSKTRDQSAANAAQLIEQELQRLDMALRAGKLYQ